MNEAVFISDLHLHPKRQDIAEQFKSFLNWALSHTKNLYILGDFFHVWAGDDTHDAWSDDILNQLAFLIKKGINVYFMSGNRDFLLGARYLSQVGVQVLKEPTVITLGQERVLLVHGDRYCTEDKAHIWFRRLTRNAWFKPLFLMIPKKIRMSVVHGVRARSEMQLRGKAMRVETVPTTVIKHLKRMGTRVVIHGHTHNPCHQKFSVNDIVYEQYILSDWDVLPTILCYNKSLGLHLNQPNL